MHAGAQALLAVIAGPFFLMLGSALGGFTAHSLTQHEPALVGCTAFGVAALLYMVRARARAEGPCESTRCRPSVAATACASMRDAAPRAHAAESRRRVAQVCEELLVTAHEEGMEHVWWVDMQVGPA